MFRYKLHWADGSEAGQKDEERPLADDDASAAVTKAAEDFAGRWAGAADLSDPADLRRGFPKSSTCNS